MAIDPHEAAAAAAENAEHAPGFKHDNLEGLIPPMASDVDVCAALEQAFDYRGDVTLTMKDGAVAEGYVFDRHTDRNGPASSYVRLLSKDSDEKRRVRYCDIARIEFTGRDTAAGKSFATWVQKYRERKAAGETGIRIEPEKLD